MNFLTRLILTNSTSKSKSKLDDWVFIRIGGSSQPPGHQEKFLKKSGDSEKYVAIGVDP